MSLSVIEKGVRFFAEKARTGFEKVSDLDFQLTFPNEEIPTLISIYVHTFTKDRPIAINYTVYCGALTDSSVAPGLLQENWGSIDVSGFYLSVHLEDNEPWLVLETTQFLGSQYSVESVVSLLGECWLQYKHANVAVQQLFGNLDL